MTRIKIKTSEICYSLEEVQTHRLSHYHQKLHPQATYFPDGGVPILRNENKRKRTPRNCRRRVKRKHHFLFSSDGAAGPIEELDKDKGANGDNKAKERVADPKEYEGALDSRREKVPAVIKTYTARRRMVESVNGINKAPEGHGNVPLRIPFPKFRDDALVEKQRGVQDLSCYTRIVTPAKSQNVIRHPDNESTAVNVDKQQNKSNGSLEGPVNSHQSLSKNVTPYQGREMEKEAAMQLKGTKAEKWAEKTVTLKTANDSLPGGYEVHRASASPANWLESKKDATKQFKVNHNMQADFDKNELTTALKVIKKIMRMEAAEPFNSPVDPVALGIPDYFNLIDTPMDFGTICETLEKGQKYQKSQDVYEDIQLIWINCRKYNNKGDPILELLKRVKKNFMKYWTAAGLYTDRMAVDSKAEFVKRPPEDASVVHSSTELKIETEQLGQFCISEDGANGSEHKNGKQNDWLKQVKKDIDKKFWGMMLEAKEKNAESRMQADILSARPLQESRETLVRSEKISNHEQHHKTDSEIQNTPTKPRRVSGTGHHKFDCSCVVCTGVRRKLAREKGLTTPEIGDDKSHVLTVVENVHAEQNVHVDQNCDGKLNSQLQEDATKDVNKNYTKRESKGISLEDTEDIEDCVHFEEHFTETIDAEIERQEGEMARYYCASYEIPLRKVNTTVLRMSQILFWDRTTASPWSQAHSLTCKTTDNCKDNALLTAVRLFVDDKKFSDTS